MITIERLVSRCNIYFSWLFNHWFNSKNSWFAKILHKQWFISIKVLSASRIRNNICGGWAYNTSLYSQYYKIEQFLQSKTSKQTFPKASGFSKKYQWILVYGRGKTMITKYAKDTLQAFKKLKKNTPEKLWIDKGTENAENFKKVCKEKNIEVYSTMSETKSCICRESHSIIEKQNLLLHRWSWKKFFHKLPQFFVYNELSRQKIYLEFTSSCSLV